MSPFITKRIVLLCIAAILLASAQAFGATTQSNISALIAAGKCGTVLQGMAMERCNGIMTWNRPYMGDAVKDCYGYTRQVWNAILFDGSTHSEDYTDYSYDTAYYWLGISGGIPVNTYPDSNWATISSLGGVGSLLPGDVCGTSQGHQWGMSVHYGMYAGKNSSGSNMCYQCGGGYNGAYYTPWYSGWTWYYVPLHTALATPSGNEVILDNTAATFTGSWSTGTSSSDKYGDNYNFSSVQSSQTATATWRPTVVKPGYYDVFVWYPQGSNRTASAPYTVYYRNGSETARVDQRSGGGAWKQIASSKPFLAGTGGYIVLGNGTGESSGVVMADAIRLRFAADLDLTPPTISMVSRTPVVVEAGHPIRMTVMVTDNKAVTSVTADGVVLTEWQSHIYTGNVPASAIVGTHSITVIASDADGNASTSTSATYRTAKVVAASTRVLTQDKALASAVGTYLFRTWGTATVKSTSTFALANCGSTINVTCPSHGLATGNFASACGTWDPATSTISCQNDQVHKSGP